MSLQETPPPISFESFTPEYQEQEPFKNRVVLVTGGNRGMGLQTALKLRQLGARVILNARTEDKFNKAVQQLGRLGEEKVIPFIADLTHYEQTHEAVKKLIAEGQAPTDVILNAAGGMEPYARELTVGLLRIDKRQVTLKQLQTDMERWKTDDVLQKAREVNYEGPVRLMEALTPQLPDDAKTIDISSLWSSFVNRGVHVPEFYMPVARTKGLLEQDMIEKPERFKNPVIISGNLIKDSLVGKIFGLISSLLPENQREIMQRTSISMQDMIDTTTAVLASDPRNWPETPLRLYVIEPRRFTNNLSPDNEIFKVQIPL